MKAKRKLLQICPLGAALLPALASQAQLTATKISSRGSHTLFLKNDGSLWAMGDDESGQFGDGATNFIVDLPELIFGPAPKLRSTTCGNQPMVFFPTGPGLNNVLQMTTNLVSPHWVAVTNYLPCTAALILNAPTNAFFRLQ